MFVSFLFGGFTVRSLPHPHPTPRPTKDSWESLSVPSPVLQHPSQDRPFCLLDPVQDQNDEVLPRGPHSGKDRLPKSKQTLEIWNCKSDTCNHRGLGGLYTDGKVRLPVPSLVSGTLSTGSLSLSSLWPLLTSLSRLFLVHDLGHVWDAMIIFDYKWVSNDKRSTTKFTKTYLLEWIRSLVVIFHC